MIIVTGRITARADGFDDLRTAALAHVVRSRTEPGCISHGVAVDCEAPLDLVFFERWADAETLEIHLRHPGSAEFMTVIRRHAASTVGPDLYPVADGK